MYWLIDSYYTAQTKVQKSTVYKEKSDVIRFVLRAWKQFAESQFKQSGWLKVKVSTCSKGIENDKYMY